jgi:phosphatidylglycerol---prolipoprotein diacylglyceryl transferase
MLIHWNYGPEIFSLGPLHLRWYGLMFLTGFSIGFQLMKKVCVWENKDVEKLDQLLFYIFLGTLIGARLGHCLFYDFTYYSEHPLEIFAVWQGGLASHGGGTGVIIALYLFSRKNPEFSLWWLLDRIAVFTVMTGGFIRIGNLMNSEILGKPTDGSWGVVFERVDLIPRHPAMIYESICYFLIFAVTYKVYLKFKEKTPPGLLFGLVISMIMSCRFAIEFFKEPQSAFEKDMFINMGQILSLPFIALGIYLVVRALRSPKMVQGKTARPVHKKPKK